MSRLLMFGAFALATTALPLAPATAQSDYYGYNTDSSSITVTGPHSRRVGRTSAGIPIIEREAAQTVDYSDLDLRTGMDRERLRVRVDNAAYEACQALDDAYGMAPDSLSEPRDCHRDAVRRAEGQVRAAIDGANYYGTSASYGY
jgi:UrcA family protein